MCIEFYRRPIEERVVHALGKAWHVEVSLHIKNSEQVHHFFKTFVSCISRQFHINTGLFILFYFNNKWYICIYFGQMVLINLLSFTEKATWNHENIQVDLRYSIENIEILDVSLSFQNNEILTDIYSKPSCHPENTTKTRLILYGLAAYAKHICTDNNLHTNKRKETQFLNN